MTGMATCDWCKREMTRHGLKSHRKLHCEKRPDLVKARATQPPEELPKVAPTHRPVEGRPFEHACPCGRNLLKSRMYVHAIACSWARQDGYEPPAKRTRPCKCGCGGTVESGGVKTASFIAGHYDRWIRAQFPERKKEKPRPLAVVMREKEREAMEPLGLKEEEIRRAANAVRMLTGKVSHALWFLLLDVKEAA